MPDLLNLAVFPLFLVFVRLGAAFMMFPAFSDPSIDVRARLLVAVTSSLMLWPMVESQMPAFPPTTAQLVMYVVMELFIGILMALSARLFMSAINVAGEMIAFATGFQAATLFDPVTNSNTTAPTLFLMMVAGTLVFATNAHHVMIEGVVYSYTAFPPGSFPHLGDTVQALIQVVQDLFLVGLKIAAPVVSVGFLTYVAFGIFNRLIPQLHVFFVALPLSIVIGLFLLAVTMGSMMMLFSMQLHEHIILFNVGM